MKNHRIIKKYQNRRLYDTFVSVYITLQEVKELVMLNSNFVVIDAKTNKDITRQVLLSIILEEEAAGVPIFSNQLLKLIISFYGHTFQSAFGRYLEGNIRGFVEAQQNWQNQMSNFIDNPTMKKLPVNKFMNLQVPNMQNLVNSYFENGKQMFDLMKESLGNNPWSQTITTKSNKNSQDKNKSKTVRSKSTKKKV